MDAIRLMRLIVVCGALLTAVSTLLYLKHISISTPASVAPLTASNTYLGPVGPLPGNPKLVQVELIVRDAPEAAGVQVVSVDFAGKNVPLKPRDVYGNRGEASFQLKPGKYRLRWTVNRDKIAWPRTIKHEEEVNISPRDLWLQIYIEGDEASIR